MRVLRSLAFCSVVACFSGPASATDIEALAATPCEHVTLDYNSRQRWQLGFSQYGVSYEAWTAQAFDVLRERAVACSNPDTRSFITYITYLEGINADALQALENNRRQRALAEEEAKRKAEREAERAVKEQQAAEEAERQRLAEEEAARAREHQQAAEAAERKSQAELKASALLDTHEPQAEETAIVEPRPAHPNFPLDEDVKLFVKNNPIFAKDARTPTADDLMVAEQLFRNQAVVELALILCNERWSDFPGLQEEASRRIDLLQRVYFQYLGLPLDKFHAFRESANQVFESTPTTDYLLTDLNGLYQICQQSLLEVSHGLNFAQEELF